MKGIFKQRNKYQKIFVRITISIQQLSLPIK